LFPLLSIVPNIQYVVHPDVLGNTVNVTHVSANALVWGVRVMFNFGGPGSQ
jgi:porin